MRLVNRILHVTDRFYFSRSRRRRFAPAWPEAKGGPEREEKDSMGHSFGLIDLASPGGRVDGMHSGSSGAIKRLSAIALGLAVAVILPASRAAAQAAPPTQEAEVQFIQPSGP